MLDLGVGLCALFLGSPLCWQVWGQEWAAFLPPSPRSGAALSLLAFCPSQHCLHQHSFSPFFSKWENGPGDPRCCPELGQGGQELLSGSRRECSHGSPCSCSLASGCGDAVRALCPCRKRRRNRRSRGGQAGTGVGRAGCGPGAGGTLLLGTGTPPARVPQGQPSRLGGLGEGLGWHRDYGEPLARFPWQPLPAGASAPVCSDRGCLSPRLHRWERGCAGTGTAAGESPRREGSARPPPPAK